MYAHAPGVGRVLSLTNQPPSLPLSLQTWNVAGAILSADAPATRAVGLVVDPYVSKVAARYLTWSAGSYTCVPVQWQVDLSPAPDVVAAAGSTSAHDRSIIARKVCSALTLEYLGRGDECSGLVTIALLPNTALSMNGTANRDAYVQLCQAHTSSRTYPMSYFRTRRVFPVPVLDMDGRRDWDYVRTTEGTTTNAVVPEYEGPSMPVMYTMAVLVHAWDASQDGKGLLRYGVLGKFEVQYEGSSLLASTQTAPAPAQPSLFSSVTNALSKVTVQDVNWVVDLVATARSRALPALAEL